MSGYRVTTERDLIKDWITRHDGLPAIIGQGQDQTVRVDFSGKDDEADLSKNRKSNQVSWDEFFKVFEKQKLAFVYYPKQDIDDQTLSYRFIKRENMGELEDVATTEKNFSDPDSFMTLPGHAEDERSGESGKFGFDTDQDNETLQKGPSPETESEQSVSGDMTDPSSDDDTTRNARDFNLVLEDDPQAQEHN